MSRTIYKVLTIVSLLAFMITMPPIAYSSPPTILAIQPASIINTGMTPGTTFSINCTVADVINLYAWQVKIMFNPAVLNCTQATYPPYHVFAGKSYMPVTPIIDNIGGSALFGATLMGEAPPFTGSGVLCQFQFKVKSIGKSGINYSKPYGGDTFLWDSNLDTIPATAYDGFFSNMPPFTPPVASFDYNPKPPLVNQDTTFDASASYDPDGTIISYEWNFGDTGTGSGVVAIHKFMSPGIFNVTLKVTDNDGLIGTAAKQIQVFTTLPAQLYIDPPEIIDPTLLPPKIVVINVTVDDIQNMYGYYFKLGYNTDMLTCIGIMINRVQDETHFTTKLSVDDDIGLIKVNVSYYSPAIPITSFEPLHLVTITFQVDAIGASIIDLYDTKLRDPMGAPISHEVHDGLIMTLIRDIAVTNVVPDRDWVYAGWSLNITVTVKNLGNISETFNVNLYYGSNLIGTKTATSLAPNTETSLLYTWDTTGVAEGNYTIKAEAPPVPFELNTGNNVFIDGNVMVLTVVRDVAITAVWLSRSWVYQGWSVNISVVAKNLGMMHEMFTVKCYYDSNILGTHNVPDLAPNEETTIIFTWNTTDVPYCHNYTISGEATQVPFEYNTTNNIFVDGTIKVRMKGDVNGDGQIDIRDISATAQAFGSYPGHPRWNPDVDFNQDNKVDIRDISLVAKKFGQHC